MHSCINSLTFLQSPLKEEGFEILTSLVGENSGSGSSVMVVSISGLMISEVDISGSFSWFEVSFVSVLAFQRRPTIHLVCSFVMPSNITRI